MNIRSLLFLTLISITPLIHSNNKPHVPFQGSIPLKDVVLTFDEEQIVAEIASYKKMDKETKITYIVAGAAVTIAAITGAVILTVHFNQ